MSFIKIKFEENNIPDNTTIEKWAKENLFFKLLI